MYRDSWGLILLQENFEPSGDKMLFAKIGALLIRIHCWCNQGLRAHTSIGGKNQARIREERRVWLKENGYSQPTSK